MKLQLITLIIAALGAVLHAAPPNILFILADDLGPGDLGCYGQKKILTPNIDRLAGEGMRFTQMYAGAPVCSSSRCSLMTGMHNGNNRIRDNVPHGIFLRDEDITVAEVLRTAGYRTGAIGKWGLGVHGSQGKPNDQGFDEFYGHQDQDQAHFYYPDHLWDNDRVVLLPGNRGERKQQYTHDLFTERALKFISGSHEKPFFLYLAYTLPHWSDYPMQSDQSQIVPSDAPYTDRDWPQVEKNYAAMVTMIDRDVGRLMESLEKQGIANNTLVISTSDNGPSAEAKHRPAFFNSAAGLRGTKRDVYEGGIRVPMIARWPEHVPAGAVSDAPWAFWDVLPTLAEAAGTKVTHRIDGHSMLPALRGEKAPQHEYLYWDYGHTRGEYKQAARFGDWKAVRNGSDQPIELYDLKSDSIEAKNIAAQHPDELKRAENILTTAVTPHPGYRIAPPKKVDPSKRSPAVKGEANSPK